MVLAMARPIHFFFQAPTVGQRRARTHDRTDAVGTDSRGHAHPEAAGAVTGDCAVTVL